MKHEVKTYIIYDDCDCGGEIVTVGYKERKTLLSLIPVGEGGYINKCKKCGKEVISSSKSGFIIVENDEGKPMKLTHTEPKQD